MGGLEKRPVLFYIYRDVDSEPLCGVETLALPARASVLKLSRGSSSKAQRLSQNAGLIFRGTSASFARMMPKRVAS
jgi:hypothetical protein